MRCEAVATESVDRSTLMIGNRFALHSHHCSITSQSGCMKAIFDRKGHRRNFVRFDKPDFAFVVFVYFFACAVFLLVGLCYFEWILSRCGESGRCTRHGSPRRTW